MEKVQELYTRMMVELNYAMRPREGQGLVEYALIIMLVSIVVIVALTALGTGVNAVFEEINATLTP